MGYDLQMVRTPAGADEAELPNSSGIPGYYRFNVWGMRMTVGALEWADAIHYQQAPEIPPPPGDESTHERVFEVVDHLRDQATLARPASAAELEQARTYLAAHEAAVSSPSIADDRMGAYKFQSNDGWLVTPEECTLLARKLRQHADVIARDFFTDAGVSREDGHKWILGFARYNELAAEHGGYRVW